ncbi:MAG: PEP-utilizing enzyme [Planctomycetota bacterium]|nr:PEP-utilizing enzyme [Planctomycetota bacterium]
MTESSVSPPGAARGEPEALPAALESLRAGWSALAIAGRLDRAVEAAVEDEPSPVEAASKAIRAAASLLAGEGGDNPAAGALLDRAIACFTARPLRNWDEVLWALEIAALAPDKASELLYTLVVSMRLAVKGIVPSLMALGVWGDDTHVLLPKIASHLAALMPRRGPIGWMLFRQLAKSLPHVGAQGDELQNVRGAGEYLQWLLECPLTRDIREDLHSKASPKNLVLVRAYLEYLERGSADGLAKLWMAQKIPEHDRLLASAPDPADTKRRLVAATRELEVLLTRLYAFDPRDVNSVLADVSLWLQAVSLPPGSPARRDVETAVSACQAGLPRDAVEALTTARADLAGEIDSRPPQQALGVLYLDLELEKLSYLLFGLIANDDFAEVRDDNAADAVTVLGMMIRNTILKGQGTPKLQRLHEALAHLSGESRTRMEQLLVLNHHVTDEISQLSLALYRQYAGLVRGILLCCGTGNIEVEVNRFVDGLVRDTTLQHLGELSLRIHLFALDALESMGGQAAEEVRVQVDAFDRRIGLATAAHPPEPPGPRVFPFAPGQRLHEERRPEVLGGKGAALAEMAALGLPVPPGFTVCIDACRQYADAHAIEPALEKDIHRHLAWLEEHPARRLGDAQRPLLLSVRSGAPMSMPGMLDTVLNVGMSDAVARALADRLGESVALELYVRFLAGYAKTVLSLAPPGGAHGLRGDWAAVQAVKDHVRAAGAPDFWQRPREQVLWAIEGVFRSWNNPHAILFRRTRHLPQTYATAATVQQMVLGNLDERSCTGVFFTRHPDTGADGLVGEYLPRAQGEDLVAGRATPLPLAPSSDRPGESLQERCPDLLARMGEVAAVLEAHYGQMQEVEFTVESGQLYVLQTRRVLRGAAGRAAAGHPPATGEFRILARGLGAGPGGLVGRIALTTEGVRRLAAGGARTILVRQTTAPEDLNGMLAADAVLTCRGGATSHAANIARYLGKPVLHEGDELFLDGVSGEIGVPETPPPPLT